MRQQGDLIRSVYPKLILEGGNAYNEATGQMQPLSAAVLKKPPLARAVHLTLGVAVLGRYIINYAIIYYITLRIVGYHFSS